MRAVVLYFMFGVASASTDHGLTLTHLRFWRDVAAWPVIALDRVVDLGWFLSPKGQDWLTLGFAIALVLYGLAAFPLRLEALRRRERERRRRQIA